MKSKKKSNQTIKFEKGPVESLLRQLNGHLHEYLTALKSVTEHQEYHHIAR